MTRFGKVVISIFFGLLLLVAVSYWLLPGSLDRAREVLWPAEEKPEIKEELKHAVLLEELLEKELAENKNQLLELSRRNDAVGYRSSLELVRWKAENDENAARFYRRALALYPNSDVRLELAGFFESQGMHHEARREYRRLLPNDEAAERLLQLDIDTSFKIQDLLENEMWNDALVLLKPLAQNNTETEMKLYYARALVETEQYHQALDVLEELQDEVKENNKEDIKQEYAKELEFYHGLTLEALGEKEKALEAFENSGPRGKHRKGIILQEKGNTEEAAEAFSSAPEPGVRWTGAKMLENLGKKSEALSVYKDLAGGKSSFKDDAAYRAYILLSRDNDPEAEVFLRKLYSHPAWMDRLGKESYREIYPGLSPAEPDFIKRAEAYHESGREELAELEMTIGKNLATPAEKLYLGKQHLQNGDYFKGVRQGIVLLDRHPSREVYELAYPKAFITLVEEAAEEYLLDPFLVLAVMREESHFRPDAVSWAGAVGLMQIMPSTGEEIASRKGVDNFEVDNLLEPETSIRFGTWYLRSRLNNFDNDLDKALAAYNAGGGNVRQWSETQLGQEPGGFPTAITFNETREYITKVRDSYLTYLWLYGDEQLEGERIN